MSDAIVDEMAVGKSGRTFPEIEKEQASVAVSIMMPFVKVKHLLAEYAPPRRPSRVRPAHTGEVTLKDELDAWEAASDDAFESMESDLSE
ncbi:MAG TPA: hypothetical protein DD670_08565 [Planctomycetaceae bacterium]|nr:hypothetical protein [Planctomycetaceae bacterium]